MSGRAAVILYRSTQLPANNHLEAILCLASAWSDISVQRNTTTLEKPFIANVVDGRVTAAAGWNPRLLLFTPLVGHPS
jgi:hypothetical protein